MVLNNLTLHDETCWYDYKELQIPRLINSNKSISITHNVTTIVTRPNTYVTVFNHGKISYETHPSYSYIPRWLLSQYAAVRTLTIDSLPSSTLQTRALCQEFPQSTDVSSATRWQERHYYVYGANGSQIVT